MPLNTHSISISNGTGGENLIKKNDIFKKSWLKYKVYKTSGSQKNVKWVTKLLYQIDNQFIWNSDSYTGIFSSFFWVLDIFFHTDKPIP